LGLPESSALAPLVVPPSTPDPSAVALDIASVRIMELPSNPAALSVSIRVVSESVAVTRAEIVLTTTTALSILVAKSPPIKIVKGVLSLIQLQLNIK